jgi:hypothetical protein
MATPLENLQQANDDYHEAVGEILNDENIPTEAKAEFGALVNATFSTMNQTNNLIAPYYEE